MDFNDTTVIIPTLNEEKNIARLIGYLEGLYPNLWVIVSDDGSKDKTQEEVRKISRRNRHIKVYDRGSKTVHGLTVSVTDAVKRIKTRYIVVMDADFQHPPEKVGELVETLRKGYDVVIASRQAIKEGWPLSRKIISKTATMMGRVRLIGRSYSRMDFGGGFFGVRTKFFQKRLSEHEGAFEGRGYKVMFDMLKHAPKNAKVTEIPYTFGIRQHGKSKLSKKIMYYYLRSLVK
jgi:dolichol-phosphate mannosyltransferase